MKSKKKSWSVTVPGHRPVSKRTRTKDLAKTIAGAIAISVTYFGVIAILMSPAFDVALGA